MGMCLDMCARVGEVLVNTHVYMDMCMGMCRGMCIDM